MKFKNVKEAASKALEVTELDLGGQGLKRFPAAVKELRNLEILRLQGNAFSTLPDWLAELPLKQLDYSGNRLESVPEIVGELKSLEWLKVGEDPLISLPEFLLGLPALRTFYLSGINHLTLAELPDWFGGLQIEQLDLYSCKHFKHVPSVLKQLPKLRRLQLNGLSVDALPEWIGSLELSSLDLGAMPLTALPASLYQGQVRELSLMDMDQLGIPAEIGTMKSLTRLHVCPRVSKKAEAFVPDALAQLSQLEELSLVNIDFSSLPPWFAKLKGLKRLILPGRGLTEPPGVLAELPQLELVRLRPAPKLRDQLAAVQALVPNAEVSL